VRGEHALTVEGAFETFKHLVEGVCESLQLVVGTVRRDALRHVVRRDVSRRVGELLHGGNRPPGEEPGGAVS
jgi:hypothetical protein